jgi:hypothetical protein
MADSAMNLMPMTFPYVLLTCLGMSTDQDEKARDDGAVTIKNLVRRMSYFEPDAVKIAGLEPHEKKGKDPKKIWKPSTTDVKKVLNQLLGYGLVEAIKNDEVDASAKKFGTHEVRITSKGVDHLCRIIFVNLLALRTKAAVDMGISLPLDDGDATAFDDVESRNRSVRKDTHDILMDIDKHRGWCDRELMMNAIRKTLGTTDMDDAATEVPSEILDTFPIFVPEEFFGFEELAKEWDQMRAFEATQQPEKKKRGGRTKKAASSKKAPKKAASASASASASSSSTEEEKVEPPAEATPPPTKTQSKAAAAASASASSSKTEPQRAPKRERDDAPAEEAPADTASSKRVKTDPDVKASDGSLLKVSDLYNQLHDLHSERAGFLHRIDAEIAQVNAHIAVQFFKAYEGAD